MSGKKTELTSEEKSELIKKYINSSSGRSKLAAAMIQLIRDRLGYHPVSSMLHAEIPIYDRCPHDGVICDSQCESSCYRQADGPCLEKPLQGFPVDSIGHFRLKMISKVVDS